MTSDQASSSFESSAQQSSGSYDHPQTAASGPPRAALAGFWIRFFGAFIDGLLLGAANSLLIALLGRGVTSVTWLLAAAYFIYFHSSAAGQTPGNAVVGIRVARVEDGRPLTFGSATVRWAVSLLSSLVIFIGYLWMLFDDRKQTWHDKAAGSVVVKTSRSPAPGPFGKPARS